MSLEKELAEALTPAKTEPYDTEATVRRIEGGTAWVHIPGGVDETPVALTISAQAGDTVRVRISGGSAWIVGNDTAPPTDDTTAEAAQETANTAQTIARTASLNADAAKKIAGNTNQYFWHTETGTDTGAHITEIPQDDFLADPENGGGNLLARSNGIAIRDGLTELATFGANGMQIGLDDESHVVQDFHSWQMVDKEGTTYAHISDLRDADGYVTVSDYYRGDGSTLPYTTSFPISVMVSVTVNGVETSAYTFTPGYSGITFTTAPADSAPIAITYKTDSPNTKAYTFGRRGSGSIGPFSFVEGVQNIAAGFAHAEGYHTTASGRISHAEGDYSTASGMISHAEGYDTTASGEYSHAEGYRAKASGNDSHAEGHVTTASGEASHAEGYNAIASGRHSHAQNYGTIAANSYQTALGKYNEEDTAGDYAVIIGNGTADDARSNALTVDWDGNVVAAGSVTGGDGSAASGANSAAIGDGVTASGANSAAFGEGTAATGDNQMVLGNYNEDQTALFLIGNGTSDSDRSNAFRVQKNGITHFRTRDRSGTIGEDIPASSNSQLGGFSWYDKNGGLIGYNQIIKSTADHLYMSLAVARNNAGGTQIRNGLYLDILADGTKRIRFYDTASRQAWLDALGIGEKETASPSAAISTTSGTAKAVTSVSLSAGTWMVIGHVHYNAGGTAGTYRAARLGSTAAGAQYAAAQVAGSSGGNTNVQVMAIVTLSDAGTVYLSAQQGSGSNLNVSTGSGIEAVKIGF